MKHIHIEYISEASSNQRKGHRHVPMENFQLIVSTIQEVATDELFIRIKHGQWFPFFSKQLINSTTFGIELGKF